MNWRTSICFRASAGLRSLLKKPDSRLLRSVNQIPAAGSFSAEHGDCLLNLMSESSTAESMQESLFSPEDHLASLPAVPGSREAKEMCAGSGRKLCVCLTKQNRIASFSRILLESSTWGSTEYFLKWEGRATKCNASIFRLVPWTRPNSGTESGLSVSYPTPRGSDAEKSGPNQMQHDDFALAKIASTWPTLHGTAKEEYERRQGPTGNELGNLVNRTAATWPALDASEAGKTSRSGNRKDEPLIDGIVRTSWPTPQSRDEKGETQNAHRMDAVPNVPNVLKASWPTPNASDGSGGAQNPEKRKAGGHVIQLPDALHGKTQYGCLARTENFVVRLTTLSTWLMGYTGAYLARWETRSVRKS